MSWIKNLFAAFHLMFFNTPKIYQNWAHYSILNFHLFPNWSTDLPQFHEIRLKSGKLLVYCSKGAKVLTMYYLFTEPMRS
jgi:hypothetical protein